MSVFHNVGKAFSVEAKQKQTNKNADRTRDNSLSSIFLVLVADA